eukprot:12908009-Prorocentrum_lima.AAC.1
MFDAFGSRSATLPPVLVADSWSATPFTVVELLVLVMDEGVVRDCVIASSPYVLISWSGPL